ncbi:MAG: N-acetylmuramoyl-L-alanine amidase [Candidatus Omnitrophota bacterium]
MPVKKISFLLALLVFLFSGCVTTRPVKPPAGGIYHTVGSGQTLYRISKTYGVDIKDIMRVNDIKNPSQIGVGEKLFIPRAASPLHVEPYRAGNLESLKTIVGKKQKRIRWKTITLHHSATKEGNAESFDRNHRRRGMGGLAYHFVIGNGTSSGNGEIEVGWRWRKQVETNRKRDIQICLVGNFNQQRVSEEQFKSLVKLLKIIMQQYGITVSKVRRHKDVPRALTECPGKNFPINRIKSGLKSY